MKPSNILIADLVADLVFENDRAVKQAIKNTISGSVANLDNGAVWETCFRAVIQKHVDRLEAQIEELEKEKFYWNCSIHGESQTAWGCPECMREARQTIADQQKEIERLNNGIRELEERGRTKFPITGVLSSMGLHFISDFIDYSARTIAQLEAELAKVKDECERFHKPA